MNKLQTTALLAAVAGLLLSGCTGGDSTTSSQPTASTMPVSTAPTSTSGTMAPTTSPAADTNPFPVPSGTVTVDGRGATFPQTIIQQWTFDYIALHSNVMVNYAPVGSGKGISAITNKEVTFGASDAPLAITEKAAAEKAGETLLQIPETVGTIAVIYNQKVGVDNLRLDGETVGKIYGGSITMWDDAAIKALNPTAALPHQSIFRVARGDSSGTTYVFTDYLMHTSGAWNSSHAGPAKPALQGVQDSPNGNDGVAASVRNNDYALGYVELHFARTTGGIRTALLKSHDGEFLAPSTDGGAKAANQVAASLPAPDGDWSKISIVNLPGAGVYPVSTFTYILAYQHLADYSGHISSDQYGAFKGFMWWALHDGQRDAVPLDFSPLPASVVQLGEGALRSMA